MDSDKGFKKGLRECIALCALLALLSFGWAIIEDKGALIIAGDFINQQIPFTIGLHNALLDGGFGGWSWNVDLGASTLQAYSFYEMGSIFFYISMLFPANWFPYIVGWIYILKYIVAGAMAYLYISRFLNNKRFAVIGAVLYAFSGFQSTNMEYYHFHDAVAFFPLMLYGLERMMEDKRSWGIFVFAVFLNAMTNYFFFVQDVVFLVIYFVLRFWTRNIPELLLRALLCIGCGALGMAMSAVILLPSVMYIIGSERGQANLLYIDALLWESRRFLQVVKGIFLPGEAMMSQNSVFTDDYYSTACYLPLVGMSFVFAYMGKNKNWLSRLAIVLLIMAFSPFLTALFLLGTAAYQRWWYIMVMVFALCSSIVAENHEDYDIKKGAITNGVIVITLCCALWFLPCYEETNGLVFHWLRFVAYELVCLGGLGYVYFYGKGFTRKIPYYRYLLFGVSAMAVVTTSMTLYVYRSLEVGTPLTSYKVGETIELPDAQYRIYHNDNRVLFTGDAIGTYAFTSTTGSSVAKFNELFDYVTHLGSIDKASIPGLRELLGAKYYLSDTKGENTVQTIQLDETTKYVEEGIACPIGYRADSYILKAELMELDKSQRAIAMLDSIVIEPECEEIISQVLPHNSLEDLDLQRSIEEYVEENTAREVKNFSRDGKGFSCTTDYAENGVVWFSVPYDEGWSLMIDGEEAQIICSGEMMAVVVPMGEHQLSFSYCTPGYKTGVIISTVAWMSFAALLIVTKKKRQGLAQR